MTATYAVTFFASLALIAFPEKIINAIARWYKQRARRKDQHRRKRQGDAQKARLALYKRPTPTITPNITPPICPYEWR